MVNEYYIVFDSLYLIILISRNIKIVFKNKAKSSYIRFKEAIVTFFLFIFDIIRVRFIR